MVHYRLLSFIPPHNVEVSFMSFLQPEIGVTIASDTGLGSILERRGRKYVTLYISSLISQSLLSSPIVTKFQAM